MDKAKARKFYREIRHGIDEEEKDIQSKNICDKLMTLIEEGQYNVLLLYAPLKDEPDVMEIYDSMNGKADIYFPRVLEDWMDFYKVNSINELESGYFGVREPSFKCEKIEYKDNMRILMAVPGIAFDDRGYRIGYGKGFYDRYLSVYKDRITTVGICFKECRAERIANDEHDIAVDIIL